MSWDEYGDEWGYDDRGIPVYVGNGDYHPDDEDYAYVEDQDAYDDRGYADQRGHHAYPQQGYGHSYGYGYPYGAVITETTVTTGKTIVTETYYEDVEVAEPRAHRAKSRRVKARKYVRPYGERG
jgi:hypothetical protein